MSDHLVEPGRELGTIVAWDGMGMGRLRADNGDSIPVFYWSVLQGFRQMTIGRRVEFSRIRFGVNRTAATLVTPVSDDRMQSD